MKTETSKAILGKMTSREATKAVIEDVAVKFHKWMDDDMTIDEHEDFMNKNGNVSDYATFYTYFIDNIYIKPE